MKEFSLPNNSNECFDDSSKVSVSNFITDMKTPLDYKHLNFDTRHDIEEEYAVDKSEEQEENFFWTMCGNEKKYMYTCKHYFL